MCFCASLGSERELPLAWHAGRNAEWHLHLIINSINRGFNCPSDSMLHGCILGPLPWCRGAAGCEIFQFRSCQEFFSCLWANYLRVFIRLIICMSYFFDFFFAFLGDWVTLLIGSGSSAFVTQTAIFLGDAGCLNC